MQETLKAFERLISIVKELRIKCPWDNKQTLESLRPLTVEEVYELSDAIIELNINDIRKELGDVLLHVIFYSIIAEEKQTFNLKEVIEGISEKLIRRHPHIYADIKVNDADEVMQNWENIKLKEGATSVLGGIPTSAPPLLKAKRIQEKVASVGFDWEHKDDVFKKIEEELDELKTEINKEDTDKTKATEEFGDLFFSLINYARHYNIDPDVALEKTNQKFIQRFQYIEKKCKEAKQGLNEVGLEELEVLWEKSKS